MCGDGANDCGALKAAHTGISLSEAESSVASPFTSRKASVECVVKVIREGRAALVTSFGIFKFMAGYSLVQFASVLLLYSIDNNLSDNQYLYIDLFTISLFAFAISRTPAYEGPLVKQRPETSLVSALPLASLIGQLIIAIVIQIICFKAVQRNDWFAPYVLNTDEQSVESYENYAVFCVSALQYIIIALVFNKGPPFRQGLQSNWCLTIISIVMIAITVYLCICPTEIIRSIFELKIPPDQKFCYILLSFSILNLALAVFLEKILCDRLLVKFLKSR